MSDAAKDTVVKNTVDIRERLREQQGDVVDLQEEREEGGEMKYAQIQRSVERAIDANMEKILSKGYSLRNTKRRLTEAAMQELTAGVVREERTSRLRLACNFRACSPTLTDSICQNQHQRMLGRKQNSQLRIC